MTELTLETCHAKQSRGRTGSFTPRSIRLTRMGMGLVSLEVWGNSRTHQPPIALYLADADTHKLGLALLAGKFEDDKEEGTK